MIELERASRICKIPYKDEWNNLIARAKRENKRVFASPLPLLEIGKKDIDLIVALNDRDFTERNKQRGGNEYGTRGWKQSIDKELLKQALLK